MYSRHYKRSKRPRFGKLANYENNGGEEIVKTDISSMAQSIYVLKNEVYKGRTVEFAGGLTLNVSSRQSNRSK